MKPICPLLLLIFLSCFPLPDSAMAKTLGAGLSLNQPTSLSEILGNPEPYIGKKIQLQGVIVDVCEKRGCWLYISGDRPFEKIRFKVLDGEIVIPLEARGKPGTVEGVLEKFVLSRDEVIARRRHHAEERGETFDPASVTSGETIYQLRGLGAEIDGI